MKRSNALALVAVVFVAGVLVGGLATRLLYSQEDVPHSKRFGPQRLHRFFPHGDFDLSTEQREAIHKLFERRRRELDALHSDLRPRVEELMEAIDGEVKEILTPDQQELYETRRRRWRRPSLDHEGRRHWKNHGPPRGHDGPDLLDGPPSETVPGPSTEAPDEQNPDEQNVDSDEPDTPRAP